MPVGHVPEFDAARHRPRAVVAPAGFALLASGVVGFAFFLMELVWYRMLGPLLGGTVFTFSLILAVALAGIGIGGLVYAVWGSERRPSLRGFAACSLLEALPMAIPYALGDRLAVLTVVPRTTPPEETVKLPPLNTAALLVRVPSTVAMPPLEMLMS